MTKKGKINLDWSKFVKIYILSRKYIYNVSPETSSMFLTLISMHNKPGPNTDILRKFNMPEILGQNIGRIHSLRNSRNGVLSLLFINISSLFP